MATAIKCHGTLYATLCEIERGVFYASYHDCDSASDTDELTSYQTGPTALDAKRQIELAAHALGYETVVWTETVIAPLFANRIGRHQPVTTLAGFGNIEATRQSTPQVARSD